MIRLRYRLDRYGCFLLSLMALPLAPGVLNAGNSEYLIALSMVGLLLLLLRSLFGEF